MRVLGLLLLCSHWSRRQYCRRHCANMLGAQLVAELHSYFTGVKQARLGTSEQSTPRPSQLACLQTQPAGLAR
jgi:hypothetical protein